MDDVALVREKIDIVSLIGETVTLKKAGRNFKGLCPFHTEKSPSFMVSPERQIWHCFGCQKGGDAYTFVMEQDHAEFPEALRMLAKRAGVTLHERAQTSGMAAKKERFYEMNALAMEFYHYLLTQHPAGKSALEYIEGRKINDKVVKTFQLGFAPNQKDALVQFMNKKKKFTIPELVEAGLASQNGNSVRDFFWNRLMFPLYDHRDNVVGFAGRILTQETNGPKYINTKDTVVYHKGQTFFGIQVTKDNINKAKQAILVEGELDLLTCFQAGITNVLAVKGTALTDMQVTLLSRYAEKVTMCLDGDKAGQEAIKRSIPLLEKKNLAITVVLIPGGKDPDEAIKTNELAFKMAIKHDTNVYDYLFSQAVGSVDPTSGVGKKQIADTFLPTLATIENPIVREHYLKKLSNTIDTSYESLVKELDRLSKPVVKVQEGIVAASEPLTREEVLEEYLVSLIVQAEEPKKAVEIAANILSGSMSKERAYQKVLYHLLDFTSALKDTFDHKIFSQQLPTELLHTYNKLLLFPLPKLTPEAYTHELQKTAEQMRMLYLKAKIRQLTDGMKKSEASGDSEGVAKLQDELVKTTALLQRGKN